MPAISITALDDPVAIVHIPIHLAHQCSSKIYWTSMDAADISGEFFNVTSNRIEIAIFARTDLIHSHWNDVINADIRINATWRVFEISSGDEGETTNYDSPHLRHVSAPLSRAGISILYQSSYFTDFILVKESDFPKASTIFAEQGWHVDPSVPYTRRRSQLISPITPITQSAPTPPTSTSPSSATYPSIPEVTVLSPPLACVGFSRSNEQTVSERIRQLVCWPDQANLSWRQKRLSYHSGSTSPAKDHEEGRPFISLTRTDDGVSLLTETRILRCMFGKHDVGGEDDDEEEGGEYQLGGRLAMGYVSDTTELEDSGDDDGGDDDGEETPIHYHRGDEGGTTSEGERIADFASATQHRGRRSRPMSLPVTPKDSPGSEIPISWCRTTSARHSGVSLRETGMSGNVGRERLLGNEGGDHPNRHGEEKRKKHGRKRCLQLDLRGVENGKESVYHLDKSGLVTRFSNLLDSSSIRMLYSSTFHTANILVEARDVMRAKRLLEGRGNNGKGKGDGYF